METLFLAAKTACEALEGYYRCFRGCRRTADVKKNQQHCFDSEFIAPSISGSQTTAMNCTNFHEKYGSSWETCSHKEPQTHKQAMFMTKLGS